MSSEASRHTDGPSALTELLASAAAALVVMGLLAVGYSRQGYPAPVGDAAPALSGLMFGTLGGGLAIGLVAFAVFLSSSRNRQAAERGLET